MTASISSAIPGPEFIFVAVLALAFAPWLAVRAYRDTQPLLIGTRRRLLTGLRLLALWLVLAMLAEPVLFRSRTVLNDPSVLLLVDDSASMAVETADGGTRYSRALRWRDRAAEALLESASGVRLLYGSGSRRLERSSGPEHADHPPTGEGTDLNSLLVSAAQRHLEDHLAGILVFSDGQNTEREAHVSLAGLNVPVWAVATGDSVGPPDLRLDRVRYPSRVSRGERLVLEGELVARVDGDGQGVLRLSQNGEDIDSLSVSWNPGTGRVPFQFVVTPDSIGYARYQVALDPVEGENILRNNRVQVGVRVEKERLRVLQLQSHPSWDGHFLKNAIPADRRIDWHLAYMTPSGLRLAESDSTVAWPLGKSELRKVDLFVVGDPAGLERISDPAAGVIDAVRAGAGLWILAADVTAPVVWPAAVRAMAPIVPGTSAGWVLEDYRVDLPVMARSHAIWAFTEAGMDAAAELERVPPLQARLSNSGASVDADLLLRGRSGAREFPVLGVRREGRGRVAVWAGAPLWRWSFWRLGEEGTRPFFSAMVANLTTWLAEGADRQRLRLQIPRPVVAEGEEVRLNALALDRQMRPDAFSDVWLEWARAGADSTVAGRVRMHPDSSTPGGRDVDLPALPSGEYLLRVALEEGHEGRVSAWQPFTVDPYSVEVLDPRVDPASLDVICRATGGDRIGIGELDSWVGGMDLKRRASVLTGRVEFGAGLWLLLPLLLVLSVEWALRKRFGLI